jgi:hypothetical protein
LPHTVDIPGALFLLGVRGKTVVTAAPGFGATGAGLIDFNNRESVLKIAPQAKLYLVNVVRSVRHIMAELGMCPHHIFVK